MLVLNAETPGSEARHSGANGPRKMGGLTRETKQCCKAQVSRQENILVTLTCGDINVGVFVSKLPDKAFCECLLGNVYGEGVRRGIQPLFKRDGIPV